MPTYKIQAHVPRGFPPDYKTHTWQRLYTDISNQIAALLAQPEHADMFAIVSIRKSEETIMEPRSLHYADLLQMSLDITFCNFRNVVIQKRDFAEYYSEHHTIKQAAADLAFTIRAALYRFFKNLKSKI